MSTFSQDLSAVAAKIKGLAADLNTDLPGLLTFITSIAGVAEEVAPLTGSAAPEVAAGAAAASAISTALDNIVTAHNAGGQTQASAIASVASLANAVTSANIPGVSAKTVQSVANMVSMVATVAPEVAAAIVPAATAA